MAEPYLLSSSYSPKPLVPAGGAALSLEDAPEARKAMLPV